LREKYLAKDGGPGTYNRFAGGDTWRKTQSITTQSTQQPAAKPESAVPNGFVLINGGTFMMGSPANEPGRNKDEVQHQVTVSSFYMGKYEVTKKEFQEIMGVDPNSKGDNFPVDSVSWNYAIEYCNRRSQKEGLTPAYTIIGENVTWNRNANGYRLPTEAEWEYACRAGTTTAFNNENNDYKNKALVEAVAWYRSNSLTGRREVGLKTPNSWGLYDMHGNVEEWCWDLYGSYSSEAQTDPTGADSGTTKQRVCRGGGYSFSAERLRSAYRSAFSPDSGRGGFRVVRNIQ